MINKNNVKFYFYNGFSKPELLADNWDDLKNNLRIESNYLGDVTEGTLEGLEDILESFDTVEDAQEYGENVYNDVWINPTLENLADANEAYGLDRLDYLNDFLG